MHAHTHKHTCTQTDRQTDTGTHTHTHTHTHIWIAHSLCRFLIERSVNISPYKEVKLGMNGASVHSPAAVNQNLQPTSLHQPSSTISGAVVNKIPLDAHPRVFISQY